MVISEAELRKLAARVLRNAGASPENSDEVADHLVLANLSGVDTHGVYTLLNYVGAISKGQLNPTSRPVVLKDGPSHALVSGEWTFGQVGALRAIQVAIAKAARTGIAIVGLVQTHHIGRVGHYAELAAEQGLVSLIYTGGYGQEQPVAFPYGGRQPLLSTNPIAFGFPSADEPSVTFDFATTAVAATKIMIAREHNQPVPPNLIVDRDGQPSTNPEDFFTGGGLVPFGGHKGYALMVATELLGRIFTGADRFADTQQGGPPFRHQGVAFIVFRVDLLDDIGSVRARVDDMQHDIHSVPPASGFERVLVPGEPERQNRQRRREDGIHLEDDLWHRLNDLAS